MTLVVRKIITIHKKPTHMEEAALHPALPQFMTPENLALWIKENQVEQFEYVDDTPLTQDEISELEHKSSIASRTIDELDNLEKSFKKMLKEGTEDPVDFTIPPTKGTKTLKSNRKFADDKIKSGAPGIGFNFGVGNTNVDHGLRSFEVHSYD